jgi:hypothetical protein
MMSWTTKDYVFHLLSSLWKPVAIPPGEDVPWEEIYHFIQPTSLGGVMYWTAQEGKLSPPQEILDRLAKGYYKTIAANHRCLDQLGTLHRQLTADNISFLLLKGAAVVFSLYPEPAPRKVGDIDIVVHPEQVSRCRVVLEKLGYAPTQIEQRPGIARTFSNEEVHEPADPHSAGVELHWHLLDVPYYMARMPMAWFWENVEEMELGGTPYQVLNPEARLIYSAAHLAYHHRFKKLHSYLDLALLLDQRINEIDVEKVVTQAREFELIHALEVALGLLSGYWPELPTSDLRNGLKAVKPTAMDGRLFRLLTAETRSTTLDFYTTLVSLPDFPSRARYAWSNLFPQEAYMLDRYEVKRRWHLPYWYLHRLVSGLFRLVAMLPQARKVEGDHGDS